MKETYFTPANLSDKAAEMIAALAGVTRQRPTIFSIERSALLVLDCQAYFLDPSSHACVPSAAAILPGVNALIDAFERSNQPIFITRHLNTAEDAGRMDIWWRDRLSLDHPLSHIDPRIEAKHALLISKTQYDAFFGTDLAQQLAEKSIIQVIICGVMTHLCCETTARSAFMRGFDVFFTVDGTATYNEAFHRAALLNLAHGFATPVLVPQILSQLEHQEGG